MLQVFVRDNNVDQALRALKKKLQREGIFREMKRRRAYEKPSERKTREKAEAIRRARKAARKLAQREGLIPMPKRKEAAPGGAQILSLLRKTFVRCALRGVGAAHRRRGVVVQQAQRNASAFKRCRIEAVHDRCQ